jgi:histidinol dehydrogenase
MEILRYPPTASWPQLFSRPQLGQQGLRQRVFEILDRVKKDGDIALKYYTFQFDNADLDRFEVTSDEYEQATLHISDEFKQKLQIAADNIRRFHAAQAETFSKIETSPGVFCWRKSIPIEKVGIYIPGGSAPLFSSVLMLVIPANLVGCHDIALCTPPRPDGSVAPEILYAAKLTGVTRCYKLGGAQAIAALAYGTPNIPSVYKIFGPGNQYVTMAKQLVSEEGVAIDLPAGPSELAIVADKSANPSFVAADLLSQAEHGADSQVLLVTNNEVMLQKVDRAVAQQIQKLPRKEIALAALGNSKSVLVSDLITAMHLVNFYAPEHLILMIGRPAFWANQVRNAGSVFLGKYTPESVGDYASGTNHTLPTYGYARSFSGVSLNSFVKHITFQELTPIGLQNLGPVVETLALAESLSAHAAAITIRLNTLKQEKQL